MLQVNHGAVQCGETFSVAVLKSAKCPGKKSEFSLHAYSHPLRVLPRDRRSAKFARGFGQNAARDRTLGSCCQPPPAPVPSIDELWADLFYCFAGRASVQSFEPAFIGTTLDFLPNAVCFPYPAAIFFVHFDLDVNMSHRFFFLFFF